MARFVLDEMGPKDVKLNPFKEIRGGWRFILQQPFCFSGVGPRSANCVRDFANSYSGSWSWPFGQNCHSFQESAMSSCCLER